MQENAQLSEASRELAMARLRMLEPHIHEGCALRPIALEAGVTLRTAQRWVALYQAHGLAGLARKGRGDKGARRAVSPRIREAIEGLALERPPLPIRAVYRRVREFARAVGEPAPTYWMVYDLVRALPEGLLTLAHKGGKAYSEKFDLVHRREASGPNAIWQVDHSLLDIPLLREDGSIAKPWLTIVIDDYSRAIAGYYLAFDAPSSLRTALAIRQGIWRKDDAHWPVCGIPEVLYTDNVLTHEGKVREKRRSLSIPYGTFAITVTPTGFHEQRAEHSTKATQDLANERSLHCT